MQNSGQELVKIKMLMLSVFHQLRQLNLAFVFNSSMFLCMTRNRIVLSFFVFSMNVKSDVGFGSLKSLF